MIDFNMPSLGADMDEAMLVGWLVAPGDQVHRGDVIAEVETDKGIMEVECWDDGVVAELLVEPGSEKLPVGTPLARLRADAESGAEPESVPVSEPEPEPQPEPEPEPELEPARERVPVGAGAPAEASAEPEPDVVSGRRRASPRARRLAADQNIDMSAVGGTGPGGMVVAADLGMESSAPEVVEERSDDPAVAMRNAIARSMARSNREIPQYALVTRIDMKRALEWLAAANADRPITARILPAALFAKATALALRAVAELNGHFEDDRFEPSEDINLGMAISLRSGGLVAPAIRNADTLTLDDLMAALDDLVKRARSWKLRTSEMTSATATLTNLGDRGVGTAFPIVIPPQVAIIGLGRVMDRPVAIDGMLAVRPTVDATLTADHRVSDGHRGGLFLAALDQRLQEPEKL